MSFRHAAVLLAATVAACAPEAPIDLASEGAPATDPGGKADSALRRCTGRPFTAPAASGFRHTSSKLAALTGARHRAQDVIVPPQTTTELTAKFAYGPTWKDLEDERATVYFDNCSRWVELGTITTDHDGIATLPVNVLLGAGTYELRYVARGDGTSSRANLWVLPAGTHLAITDIDGTLTTSDTELWKQLFDGSYVPTAYPSGPELTRAHADRGHIVLYLTGRPSWLLDLTRTWLTNGRFTPGPVHAADASTEILPIDASVGAYKRAWLDDLEAAGYHLDLAYGNATTDIHAYTSAGIAPARQWIIGPHAGAEGTRSVTATWATRTAEVAASPRIAQPF